MAWPGVNPARCTFFDQTNESGDAARGGISYSKLFSKSMEHRLHFSSEVKIQIMEMIFFFDAAAFQSELSESE